MDARRLLVAVLLVSLFTWLTSCVVGLQDGRGALVAYGFAIGLGLGSALNRYVWALSLMWLSAIFWAMGNLLVGYPEFVPGLGQLMVGAAVILMIQAGWTLHDEVKRRLVRKKRQRVLRWADRFTIARTHPPQVLALGAHG